MRARPRQAAYNERILKNPRRLQSASVSLMSTLLIFLKEPIAGKVKTRLAATMGDVPAAQLYAEWIGVVLDRLQSLRGAVRLVGYFDGVSSGAFARWHELVDCWWPQPTGDLGDRLNDGFSRAHEQGSPVAAIGTDCLEIDAKTIRDALRLAETRDAVFGPTLDGGYYLVANSRPIAHFFDDVPWSSPETLAVHLARCERNGWTTALLPERRDIDTWDDWIAYRDSENRTA